MQDEVDRVVQAWREVRPDLDTTPLLVLSRVSRLARHLDLARRSAFSALDLEGWEFDVLSALRRAGSPFQLSPGQLLTQTLVTSGTMSNRINRLAERGLVERSRDDHDGRSVQVRLTDTGTQLVDAALADLLDRERALLASLGPDEQATLAALLRALTIPFDTVG